MKYILMTYLVFLTFTTFEYIQADQIYTWTDENGVVHYSDSGPPEDAKDVKKEKEMPHSKNDEAQLKVNKEKHNQIIRKMEAQNRADDAERYQKQQKQKAEKREAARKQLQQKVQAERNRLLKEINRINGLAVGPNYSLALKRAQLKKYNDMLKRLEKSPEDYFANKSSGSQY